MFTIWCLAMLILKFRACDSEAYEYFGIFYQIGFFSSFLRDFEVFFRGYSKSYCIFP